MRGASVAFVVVTFNSRAAIARSLPRLAAQLVAGDELIVVDNGSSDGTAATARELAPRANVLETGSNLGFAAACNRGAAAAKADLLVLLNPDAEPAPGFREAIALPLAEGRGWAAWQGLVTAQAGRVVNTRGGMLHFTGIAWAGGAGEPLASLDSDSIRAAEPGFASGACLAIPRAAYLEADGLAEPFFLYHEDVDLSLRLRLGGGRIGVEPKARVDHDYEFEKGRAKWRHLERNRWATLLRTFPAPLLAAIAPALVATELALVAIAAAGGWLDQKLLAWVDTARALPRLLRERREIQRRRRIGAREFARPLLATLDSPYVGRAARSRLLGALLRAYWSAVLWLLGSRSGSPG